jgi:hypothetical protein
MTIPTTGVVTAAQINAELYRSPGALVSMSEMPIYVLGQRSSSGPISFSSFRGRRCLSRMDATARFSAGSGRTGYWRDVFGTAHIDTPMQGNTSVRVRRITTFTGDGGVKIELQLTADVGASFISSMVYVPPAGEGNSVYFPRNNAAYILENGLYSTWTWGKFNQMQDGSRYDFYIYG